MEEVLEKMDYFMELRGRKPVNGYFTDDVMLIPRYRSTPLIINIRTV